MDAKNCRHPPGRASNEADVHLGYALNCQRAQTEAGTKGAPPQQGSATAARARWRARDICHAMDSIEVILARDPAWIPAAGELAAWLDEARRRAAPPALLEEARWWEAREAARRADWDRVSALAAEGLGEPFSEREAVRLALLHALSGDVEEAQHVLAQAIQWSSDAAMLARFAETCAAEGLEEAAATFRRIARPASQAPSAVPPPRRGR